MYSMGIVPYPREHLIKEEADYKTVEYMLERAEYVPQYESLLEGQARLGGIGYVVPEITRIPFQQLLLEYLGEVNFFYALHDHPAQIDRMMTLLDQLLTEILHHLANSPLDYVEFGDNLHSLMTNPKLFEKYCLPYYQRYSELMHSHGKKIGTHGDGDLRPLLDLLAETGLDVCESFAPAPLTSCEFGEAWEAWRNGPIIWGGIPSPILEERTPEKTFKDYIDRLLEIIGDGPIILGVSDMVVGHNLIDRVRYIADKVEEHQIN
jgi:hypothetical protein